ncbi:hypothetical protein I7I50_11357 [Histoplasma capsulatum G186AR]|uniref:Uncharacterized protein n=1 Tax=Ajellomyces capsulatus TaxID=5037 RepID=A0A8H7Z8U2_AJECA|nr:hypothetical protein I7I52_02595 [Histoplasma capsulatum]QSS69911.1 hypothetical protein I7I50_11357 [Histoplasma capsulatum G186AR]
MFAFWGLQRKSSEKGNRLGEHHNDLKFGQRNKYRNKVIRNSKNLGNSTGWANFSDERDEHKQLFKLLPLYI